MYTFSSKNSVYIKLFIDITTFAVFLCLVAFILYVECYALQNNLISLLLVKYKCTK